MNLLYAILSYAMAAFNLYRSIHGAGVMNVVFALLWLGIGIYLTLRYCKTPKDKE
ncbi:MAG: hypothetical protein Q4D50_06250 [Eubacteriales bacterium]|nr:hypothetical protein [Eubacteriales bacterium]